MKVKLVRLRTEVIEVEVDVPEFVKPHPDDELEYTSNFSAELLELANEKAKDWQLTDLIYPASFGNEYDEKLGDKKKCVCGHHYFRHFDTYADMNPCGCKYCGCFCFIEGGSAPSQAT